MSDNHKPQPTDRMANLYLKLAITFFVLIITFFLLKRFRKSSKVVLLLGLSDSGKTAIFSKIIFSKPKKSVTSLKENEATLDELNLTLVDMPGSDRLRAKYWEQYRTKASHVVFVLDATTIEDNLRDLSEYLYLLLSDSIVHKKDIRFTIACHKQDIECAMKSDAVRSLLEEELNAIRDTKTGQLGKTSDEEVEDYLARHTSGKITLDSLKVNVIETSLSNCTTILL